MARPQTTRKTGPKTRPRSAAGPRCIVCRSPRLHEVSTDLAAGMSMHAVSKKYKFSYRLVWLHVKEHMGAPLTAFNLSQPVLDQIRLLNQRTLRILAESESGKYRDPSIALQAIRESRHNCELIAKLTGELKNPAPAEPTRVVITYVDRPQLVVEHASGPEPRAAIENAADPNTEGEGG
jgi:hypothetical protein